MAHFTVYSFASTTDVIFMNIWRLFSERRPPFASPTGFYSVRHRIYVPSSDYSLRTPMVFILFIAVFVFRVAHRATVLHSDKAVENSSS